MPDVIPRVAVDCIKNKKLKPGFSYKGVWHEEHATAFTVAKAMQTDVLSDLHKAVTAAIEKGQSFESFRKNITPVLREKGWWGRKEMLDPVTGETVAAQLGSDRRLKTIYDTNMRAAFIQQRYKDIMEDDMVTHIIYRAGNSRRSREEHLAWDGLVLPKDDPWWGLHMPRKEYGCKCTIDGVDEAELRRYKTEGVPVAPRFDGTGGGRIPIKTSAPPEVYRTYVNERKHTTERVPAGVHPSFNWDQRGVGRNVTSLRHLVATVREKIPEQYDLVMSALMRNRASKAAYYGFVEDALERRKGAQLVAPVGFLDGGITSFLEKRNVRIGDNGIVVLEASLVNGKKYERHTRTGNAPSREDWYNIMDWLMDASVFWDGRGLVYLAKISDSRYMKIAVDVNIAGANHRGVRLLLPKVDTMYVLDTSTPSDRGIDELNRIMRMEKVR